MDYEKLFELVRLQKKSKEIIVDITSIPDIHYYINKVERELKNIKSLLDELLKEIDKKRNLFYCSRCGNTKIIDHTNRHREYLTCEICKYIMDRIKKGE